MNSINQTVTGPRPGDLVPLETLGVGKDHEGLPEAKENAGTIHGLAHLAGS